MTIEEVGTTAFQDDNTFQEELIKSNEIKPVKINLMVDNITLKLNKKYFLNLNSLINQLEESNMIKDIK